MVGLTYAEDVRHTEPNKDRRREAQFRVGWREAVEGREYSPAVLSRLTWHNLGYRLGVLFGATSEELVEEMYDWCVQQQAGAVDIEATGEGDA